MLLRGNLEEVSRAVLPPEVLGENLFLFSQLLVAAGTPWLVPHDPTLCSVVTWAPPLSCITTPSVSRKDVHNDI